MYCYSIHGVVVTWVVAIQSLFTLWTCRGASIPLNAWPGFQLFLPPPEKALDYLVVNAVKAVINRPA
jgi:hypothetical protein